MPAFFSDCVLGRHRNISSCQEDLCNMVDSVKTEIKQSVARDSESGLKKSELRHISSNDLTVHEEIGSGRYGTVYRAECFADTVAVKKFTPKRGCIEGLKESLVKEATNMKRLDCDSVVRPFGICTEPDNCLVVMEFMQYRSLRDFLDNPPDDYDLTWKNRIWLALGGARGLYQLHSGKPPMLHRCISSDKFLVNKSKDVKISDFGLAKTKSSAVYHGSSKNTLNYIAPEHLKNLNEKYNDKSDVYGYGIVLWEIATSMKPFEGMSTQDLLKYVLIRKRKEELPIECPHDFRDIVERCRAHEPTTRPFTGEIVEKLETAHSAC
ncbi:mixed lineage kinase domain-like protein isoform X2 [Glandiceps talaboti]